MVQSKHVAMHSPPTSAKVKNMWIITSTPTYTFMAQGLHLYLTPQVYTNQTVTFTKPKVLVYV
jgi:hypothetical protein